MSTQAGYVPSRDRPGLHRVDGRAGPPGPRWRSRRRPSPTASRSSTARRAGCSRSWPRGRRRIVEVGTAIGYSTLWMALGASAPDGTIVTIDPDRSRTDRRPRLLARRPAIADGRIVVVEPARPRGVRGRRPEPALRRAVRPGLHRRPQARVRGLRRGARPAPRAAARSSSPTTSCGRPRRRRSGPAAARRRRPTRLRAFDAASCATRGSRPRSCPSATASSSPRSGG